MCLPERIFCFPNHRSLIAVIVVVPTLVVVRESVVQRVKRRRSPSQRLLLQYAAAHFTFADHPSITSGILDTMPGPEYLTGDEASIKNFIDRFDVSLAPLTNVPQ